MASAAKVSWAKLKVGVMALAALVLLFVLIFLMTGADNPFETKSSLFVFLGDSGALTTGSAVRLNGILIGKVAKVDLTGDKNNDRAVRVTMQVAEDDLNLIPVDSLVTFSSENVLGSKFLNIKRGKAQETIKSGGELKARDDTDFLEIVQSALPLLDSAKSILNRIDRIVAQVESGKGSIGKLLSDEEAYDRFNAILRDLKKVTGALSEGQGTLGRLVYDDKLYGKLESSMAKVDSMLAGIEHGEGTAGKLLKDPALYDDLRATTKQLNTLITNLNEGKGSAGKLLKDEEAYRQATLLLTRLNNTMDKLESGRGTLGQLLVNPALYDNLTGVTAEFRGVLKDFRANPKKFLTIQLKLF